jgi:hypothetical protein
MINVRDHGAVGDGTTDDRAAFQAALDAGAGHEVYVPAGTYVLGHAIGYFWCLTIPAGTTLRGESRDTTTLVAAAGLPDSVQLLEVNAPNVTIRSLTLDGNMTDQTPSPNQQRHGVRCKGAPNCSVIDVRATAFTGDGLYFYDGSDDPRVEWCLCDGNQRNGLTLGGRTTGGVFYRSQFLGNGAQQFDSEGGEPINGVTISGCTFDGAGASDDYVLTVTGHDAAKQSVGWTVVENLILGCVLFVDAADCLLARNVVDNHSSKPAVRIYRACDRIRVEDNEITNSGRNAFDMAAIVYVTGTNPGQAPGGVVVARNRMKTSTPCIGVTAICTRDIQVLDNELVGAGVAQPATPAIWVRTTRVGEPVRSVLVQRNRVSNFGDTAVMVGGNGAAKIQLIEVSDNAFADAAGTMLAALSLDDGSTGCVVEARQSGNTLAGGCTTMVARPPGGVLQAWGDGGRWVAAAP